MVSKARVAVYLTVLIAIAMAIIILTVLQVTPAVSNSFELTYAQIAKQFVPKIQIAIFTDALYPVNNKVTLASYDQMLNGTFKPELVSLNRYIASLGTQAYPLTTITPITSGDIISPYAISPSTLIYSNNPSNLPSNTTSSVYYVYPLYEVSYTVSCPSLSLTQEEQLASINSPMIKQFGSCNNVTRYTFQAILGLSNKTETQIDEIFSIMNPSYQVGTQNFLQPLTVYNANGTIASTDMAINGTLLGYVSSLNSTYTILNRTAADQQITPMRNIFKGNLYTGEVMLAGLYCWNSEYTTLTNYFQTAKYTQYPYLYQYLYNSSTYLCLTVNSTDTILNATSNLDGTNFKLHPTILNGTLLTSFPSYVIANEVAVGDTYEYISNGAATVVQEPVSYKPYWFLPNETNIFSISHSPPYVFTELTATQYLLSKTLPVLGQEPLYNLIPVNTTYGSLSIVQQGIVTNASTYLYAPLIGNLTYQYTWNQTLGTPVACNYICDWNGSIVYSEAAPGIYYPYQYANPNYGFLELPTLNQTVYYNPQFSIIAQTPFHNDTNEYNSTYGKLCEVINQYSCLYGLSASEAFNDAKNYTAFVVYGESQNTTFIVDGFQLQGWNRLLEYLNNTKSKIVTITMLNQQGNPYWSVAGILQSQNIAYLVIAPDSWEVNPGAYPPARSLSYSWIDLALFVGVIASIGFLGYGFASAKLRQDINEIVANQKAAEKAG